MHKMHCLSRRDLTVSGDIKTGEVLVHSTQECPPICLQRNDSYIDSFVENDIRDKSHEFLNYTSDSLQTGVTKEEIQKNSMLSVVSTDLQSAALIARESLGFKYSEGRSVHTSLTKVVATLDGLLTVGSALPVIGKACKILKSIMRLVADAQERAIDVAFAGQRALDTIDYLNMLPSLLKFLDERDRTAIVVQSEMIVPLLSDLLESVQAYSTPGFFRRLARSLTDGTKTIMKVNDQSKVMTCAKS